jgi:hypothetical protein
MSKRVLTGSLTFLLLAASAWGKVFIRWTLPAVPPRALGITEVVMPFAPDSASAVRDATRQGYRVYLEVGFAQFASAEKLLGNSGIAGFLVEPGNSQQAGEQLQKLQPGNPKVPIRLLSSNGKQPQMRGQTVSTRNGVLQVSSPTAQPWLDSNLAMVRFARSSHPGVTPIYTFAWELKDSLEQENGPRVDDYLLAIAESGAIQADLVVDLHPSLEKGLMQNQPAALAVWSRIRSFMRFASATLPMNMAPWSNIGLITSDYDAAYEPMNLMARHNIPFRVCSQISAQVLDNLKVAVALTPPDPPQADVLNTYASGGGTVIVVEPKGQYPWQSLQRVETAEREFSYAVGKGRVFELAEPISDPESFAEEIRRLAPKNDVLISLWNALTTIAVPYRDDRSGDVLVEFVNFAEEPMRIQLQLKGSYSSIRYETPDHGCCQELNAVKHDGFTDFVIPSLVIGGRVHLKAAVSTKESSQH